MRHLQDSSALTRTAIGSALIGVALFNILSCSDATAPGGSGGVSPPLTAEDSRVPVATIDVKLAASTIDVGQTTQATATLYDRNGRPLYRTVGWASSDQSVATVDGNGLVTALKVGTAQITAIRGTKTGSATLTVTPSISTTGVSVASVTISPATVSVAVGGTQNLTATVRDSTGAVLTGRSVSWASSNSAVATVSGSGTVTAVATGAATITATSEGVSGSASITVTAVPPPPPPPPTGTSPEPGSGDVMLWQDNFDGANPLASYAKRGVMQIIPNGHSGNAVHFPYTASSYDNLIEKAFASTTDIYFRYWFRTSPGMDPTCGDRGGSGMKWFMAWRASTVVRYTMGVGDLSNGPTGRNNLGDEFTAHDNTSVQEPNPFLSNVNNSIRLNTTNDGQWHEYTLHIVTSLGDGTGYEQIWIDGVLVLDNSAFRYDHNPEGIAMVQFPGLVVNWYSGCDFSIDVDDLAIWHK